MRTLKLCIALGLVASVVLPASALNIPGFGVPVSALKSRNQDNGSLYYIADPNLFNGQYGTRFAVADLAANGIGKLDAPGSFQGEDTWGIFRTYELSDGQLAGNLRQVDELPGGTTFLSDSTGVNSTQLVGMFWGGQDSHVTFAQGFNGDIIVRIESSGIEFELWAVEKADLDASIAAAGVGPFSGQTLVDYKDNNRPVQNEYSGWLDATSKANGVKLLTGVSTEFFFDGQIDVGATPPSTVGDTTAYFDVDENDASGLWNDKWGSDPQLKSELGDIDSDLWFNWVISTGNRGWTAESQDNGGVANTIPEPATVLAVVFGAFGLAGYVRRRRA